MKIALNAMGVLCCFAYFFTDGLWMTAVGLAFCVAAIFIEDDNDPNPAT